MRYWQRTFVFTLILFLAAFDAGVFSLANETFKNAIESEKSVSVSEHTVVSKAIGKDIIAIESREGDTDTAIKALCVSYENYYENQGVYIRLYKDGEIISGNIPFTESVFRHETKKTVSIVNNESGQYVLVGGNIPEDESYYVVSCRDISATYLSQNNLKFFLITISMLISVLLAVALYFLMKKLSEPISNLSKASKSIAAGHYSERVSFSGTDEIAELADNFNHMAERIEEQIAILKTQDNQKQEFIDNLAHELRTPLTTIYGYAELIQKAVLTEDDKIMATDYIMNESNRLKEMAYKLLDLAMLREGKIEYSNIDISGLAENALKSVESFASDRNVRVESDVKEIKLRGDIHLLQSVIINFLNNGINACKEGGKVVLRTYYRGTVPVIEVEDNGVGMTKEEADNCFEPFYRADKARSRENGGNGLGLALCENIARNHGAKIEVESQKGIGTKMRMVFDEMIII